MASIKGLRPKPPALHRRDDFADAERIAFSFDYKGERHCGFFRLEEGSAPVRESPVEVFDRECRRILLRAAGKVDRGDLDQERRVIIRTADLQLLAG